MRFFNKFLFLYAVIVAVCSFPATATKAKDILKVEQIDALVNPLANGEYAEVTSPVEVARGESAVIQMLVTPFADISNLRFEVKFKGLKGTKLVASERSGWIRYVRSSHHYNLYAPDALEPVDSLYPDPIVGSVMDNVSNGQSAALWIDVPIAKNVNPGTYSATVTFSAESGGKTVKTKKTVSVKVYPVTLEKQSLMVTNWYFPEKFSFMNNGKDVAPYSQEYWEMLAKVLDIANDFGQNVWMVTAEAKPVVSDGKIVSYDFSNMDKYIDFLFEHCNVEKLEGNHIGQRATSKWTEPEFAVEIPVVSGDTTVMKRLPARDPRTAEYVDSYFKALTKFLKNKKTPDGRSCFDIYVQHVADEPINANRVAWEALTSVVKAASPEIKVIEAYRSDDYDPSLIDVVVPQLDEILWDSYQKKETTSDLWFYTCMYPRENYANRFVCIPLIKTRIIHWFNFMYGFDGYLHWGFNYWGFSGDPMGDVSFAGSDLPGGDAYIIYPGYHTVYPSIRLAAMRDGINDYTLLKMVEKKSAAKAKEYVESQITNPTEYSTSVEQFRTLRHNILEYLSE